MRQKYPSSLFPSFWRKGCGVGSGRWKKNKNNDHGGSITFSFFNRMWLEAQIGVIGRFRLRRRDLVEEDTETG